MSASASRDEILAVLKKHLLATIDGLTDEAIGKAKTLEDIGASSLDVVEVVSATMRELKIKVPRSELMLVESLEELVDVLHQRSVAAGQTPPHQ